MMEEIFAWLALVLLVAILLWRTVVIHIASTRAPLLKTIETVTAGDQPTDQLVIDRLFSSSHISDMRPNEVFEVVCLNRGLDFEDLLGQLRVRNLAPAEIIGATWVADKLEHLGPVKIPELYVDGSGHICTPALVRANGVSGLYPVYEYPVRQRHGYRIRGGTLLLTKRVSTQPA